MTGTRTKNREPPWLIASSLSQFWVLVNPSQFFFFTSWSLHDIYTQTLLEWGHSRLKQRQILLPNLVWPNKIEGKAKWYIIIREENFTIRKFIRDKFVSVRLQSKEVKFPVSGCRTGSQAGLIKEGLKLIDKRWSEQRKVLVIRIEEKGLIKK